jgi:hypothetical protein
MDKKELRKITEANMSIVNKPSAEEETPKMKSKGPAHEITKVFSDLYQQKFGRIPGGKQKEVEDNMPVFIKEHGLTYADMIEWAAYLIEREIKGNFKGGFGCLVSNSMITDWLSKRATTPEQFQQIVDEQRNEQREEALKNIEQGTYVLPEGEVPCRPGSFVYDPKNADKLTERERRVKRIWDSL